MADPQLDKFFKEAAAARAAKAAKPVAAAPKPPALSASPAAPVKVAKEAEERSAPSAEPVTPSAEDVKKAEKMRADLLEELPLEDFYQKAARFPVSGMAISALGERVPDKQRFFQVAGAQGIDVEDMAQKAREGVPFAEYRRTRDGVIGFKPATERFTELDRVASDYQAAERGEAPQRTIGIQKAQETTTSLPVFGEGYEVGGTTPDEIIETTKPGEHQYSIAAQFIDSFEKANPEVVSLTDMYGQNAGPGNTQKWIEKYVKMQVRNRGLTAASEDIDEQMGKLRRDAVYYILSKKTIGQWTPGVFVKDVQITDAERAKPLGTGEGFGAGVRDTFAAMAPNVEIVGFNNKGQAVVRQESPAGTALRLLDVLGVSPVGKVKGVPVVIPGQSAISGLITKDKDEGYLEAALRGVQTGATFIDAALDETKGRSTPVRAAAGLAALVPTVLYPDVTGAAEGAYTAAKAYRRVLQDRKIAKAAAPLLDELVAALKDGDYEKATKVESAIRSHPELSKGNHGVMQAQMSMDAQLAEKLKAMNPELASLTPTLGDELITVGVNQSPELAEAIYGEAVKGYPFLHFSKKAPELAARSEKEGIGPTLEAYVNSGDFGRHFQRIERAKAAFLKAAPKNSAEAIDQAVSGLAANLRAKSADVLRLGGAPAADAPRYDRLAKLLEDNKAAIIADPKAAFGKDGVLRQAIKADPVVGADDAREFRAAFYPQAARLSGRIEALKTVDFNTLYQNDLKVFDRAREAVEANIKSRMMAAELLKRELGTRAKINVVPTEILDDLMEPGTERLSAFATAKFITTMQKLPKAADRKAWLAAFQTMDKMLRGAAELRGVPVDTYWRSIDIRVVDGKPVFVKGEDVVSAPKGPGPLDGFVDVADVQTAVARLRGALAGTDPSYRLKSLLRADGSQAGGEVAVGDVVVRAIRSPQPGAPYRVEVFVGAQQKAAFTSTGKLEDAINEGIDEAQNAMTGRVAAGEPAMREVVVPKPPKTAAQAAAQTSPADAAEEAAAVDSVAATPPAAPLHPKTETVVGGLDPALKADPDVVSRILAAVDKLKAGSKLPPPPKGANKVLMGAVREELLKSGVLVKLDDGSVVKAGTLPEDVKVAPTAAPTAPPVTPAPAPAAAAEAEAPVFQRVAEEVAPPPEETLEELMARGAQATEDLRAAEIRSEEEFAAELAERERAFVERMRTAEDRRAARAREAAPPAAEVVAEPVIQRMAEEAPAAARAAEEVVPEAAPAVERAVEAAPAAKAEEAGTRTRIQELEAEVERLEPFTTVTPKRTNVKKDSFTVEIAGKKIRLENDGDSWLDVATGSELGETADGAVGLLRERLVDYPYARAQRELSSLRRAERAAAETKAAEEAVSAAPTQPSGITPAAEVPVVREEIVAPPAPPVKAEPTVDELQATVARLEPLRDAKIKRTNVTKNGFTVELAGQQVRVEKRGDNWVTVTTGRNLGDNVTEATESLRAELVLKPYAQAQDALRKLGQAQSAAATVASLEDALASVKKIKTRADAKRFFDTARELTLDANEKAQVYENLAQKLEIMAGRAKTERVADEFTDLVTQARDEVAAIRPATETAPSAVAAAADELTEAQRHAQAVTNIRSLTHRAQVDLGVRGNFLMFGGEQNGRFVPVYFINFRASSPPKPSEILESVYDNARLSPQIQEATRRDAEALLEGQTPVVSAFPANKYANDADLKFGPGLRQVRPAQAGGPEVVTGAFKPGGGSGLAGTQSIIELAAKTADPTTLLHEGAHFIRKSILDTEDMDNVTAWLNSMGVKVNHEFGEFVGSADDIELAEEMFATAFEKYVVTGKAPTPALERAFELVKNAFAGAYRWMKSDAAKELYGEDALSPQVTAVFNRYFTAVPQKPIESTFDIIVRETRGAKATDAEGALDVLAREAGRKGMPKTAREDLVKSIASLKLSDDVPNDTVLLEFPAPVLGKTEWTKGDIIELQAEVVRRRSQMAVVPVRQALFGQPEEEKVTENIYAALAEREEGGLAAGARGIARGMAKLVLGGDIVDERGTRALPEVLRRDLDTPARIIETTIGDSVSVLTQSTRDNDPSFMFRFLAGENLRFKSGRRVLSSGHEHITGFFDLYRNQYASMTREEQALLQEWAQLLNTTPNPENLRNPQTISEALASGAFPQNLMNVRNFADLEAQRKAKANAMVAALEKFIDLGGSGEGNIGGQLRKAIKDAAGEGSQIAFNEYRFAEVLLFLSGSTSRRGVRFLPVDKTFTKDQLVEQARVLLTDAQRIYGGEDDPLFSRRLSILVAAYGSSRRAKAELAALGAVLTAEEAHAFKGWTLGYDISPEMSAQLELVKNKFGLNAKFINETILGDNVYVPAQARARMADALAKAQFNNAKLTPTGDLYQKVWTYMKKRMTRGAFALRQRYFFVNTIDHFNQMYLLVGFAPAAASSARLLRFRDLLSRGGDELAARIGSALSVSKYRIDVNDILEGRDKLLLVGGNVYTARQLRDTFVAEGIFSSFDTRRLADGVRMDGNIFARELAQISGSPKSSGTFVDAASRLMDGVQDVTVDVVDDLSDAWAERERVGAVITLMETGVDARAACRVTVDALYDYSQSMTKRDRSFLVGTILPFWAFQKNANQQFINVMFSPYGAYRMMALQRLREGSVTLASELYYGYIGGELGLDADNMPQDMQDLYYAIMTRAHEIYGDDLPDNVRIGLRIALTGRVGEVVDGKYYELDTRLIEMMRSGGLAPGGKFGGAGMADYMLAAPNKSGLPSYVRDRFGMVAPQRRNALVRHYTALMGGANEDYFYFMLPESSVETAYKHTATLLGGAFLTAGALSPEWVGIPGVDILAGGADAIGLGDIGRALQPVVDLERSPVMGLALGMYSERGYPQRLHPKVAAALQRMTNIPILRVPAKMDPFMGGTLPDTDEVFRARLEAANAVQDGIVGGTDAAGNPTDLVQILGEDYVRMVQELNSKDLPADVMAVAKEERFYLPPGFMSLSFENSPLGEFNREALRWDQTSKEGADPAGQAAYFTRVLLGTDVVQVAPSRTAQQEEPVRYTKTREPI